MQWEGEAGKDCDMSNTRGDGKTAAPKKRKSKLRLYLGFLISLACVWWIGRTVELEHVLDAFSTVEPFWVACAVFATLVNYALRALRWPFFFGANPPRFFDSYRCLIVGFFMNNILPARIGEFYRAHLGGVATKQSRSVVLATVAGERLADGLMISALFGVLFSLDPVQHSTAKGTAMLSVALFFAAAGIGTVVVLLLRARIFHVLERLAKIMPGHLSGYTLSRIRRFVDGLAPMFRPQRALIITGLSLVIWTLELGIYEFVSLAFHRHMKLSELSLFMAAVNFSSLIPAAPAGAGVIELVATEALEELGIARATALSMVAVQHLTQFLCVGIPGVIFFLVGLGGKITVPESEEGSDALEEPYADVSEPPDDRLGEFESAASSENADAALGSSIEQPESGRAVAPGGDALPDEAVELSIIVPAFNEEFRLPKTLLSAYEYLHSRGFSYEVLVVDDGSTDETGHVVRQFESLTPTVRLLTYPRNRGKGYAVKFGVMNARGRLVLFMDADGSTPIEELARLEAAIHAGAHVAIGSRARYSRETDVKTVWYRKFIGRTFSALVNVLILPGIADTQCGFKLFLQPAATVIFRRQQHERFSFDVEVLYLARRAHLRIAEVPVNWTNVPGSKVNLAKDSVLMLRDVIQMRVRALLGGYSKFTPEDLAGLASHPGHSVNP